MFRGCKSNTKAELFDSLTNQIGIKGILLNEAADKNEFGLLSIEQLLCYRFHHTSQLRRSRVRDPESNAVPFLRSGQNRRRVGGNDMTRQRRAVELGGKLRRTVNVKLLEEEIPQAGFRQSSIITLAGSRHPLTGDVVAAAEIIKELVPAARLPGLACFISAITRRSSSRDQSNACPTRQSSMQCNPDVVIRTDQARRGKSPLLSKSTRLCTVLRSDHAGHANKDGTNIREGDAPSLQSFVQSLMNILASSLPTDMRGIRPRSTPQPQMRPLSIGNHRSCVRPPHIQPAEKIRHRELLRKLATERQKV